MTVQELLIFLVVIALAALALAIPFFRAWTGAWRSWARQGPGPLVFTKRNYAPLQFGVAALAIVCLAPAIYASAERLESAGLIWNVLLVVFIPVGLGMRWWWPAALTPRWHKDWVGRGGLPETPLWGPNEEVPEAQARKGWR
ncbi:hypothetical protein [Paeniglutamicibacter cryotolerans]|uniref:Uncharacterized protein n=1 Tax=Paeniglutamicibacter cryotolerans TaxID=670079 RepID=A0A839QHN1_9MICC|nr:hypothetical protein [Paeniglutamicibacter cryotolerans]MBB2995123.1 hypothetical protein [Paeniglutamicibacter cryotolerans]